MPVAKQSGAKVGAELGAEVQYVSVQTTAGRYNPKKNNKKMLQLTACQLPCMVSIL